MKEKHLYIFAGVFVVLLIIFFITKPRHTSVNVDELVQTIVFGVAKEDVRNIEVYKETGTEQPVKMVFAQKDGQWRIPTRFNSKADKSRIDRLLDEVLELTGKVRSTDPRHFETYQITDAQGIHLLLQDETNKSLANLIIGKRGEDGNSGFVRFGGKDKVYAVDKNMLASLNIYGEIDTLSQFKDDVFIDLQAVDTDKDKLELIALLHEGKQMIVKKIDKEVEVTIDDSTKTTKQEEQWVLATGNKEVELETREVDNFIRDVTKIRAEKVVDRIANPLDEMNKNTKYGFSQRSSAVVFQDKETREQKNVIFGKEYEKDKGYFMNVQYDGIIYHFGKSNYDKIFKWMEELPQKGKK